MGSFALALKDALGVSTFAVDISTPASKKLAYGSGNTLIFHGLNEHTKQYLQGHVHSITYLKQVPHGLICSVDKGSSNSSLIVWNLQDGTPERAIFDIHDGKGSLIIDSIQEYIVTLGADEPQTICIWHRKQSIAKFVLPDINFFHLSSFENGIVATSPTTVVFLQFSEGGLSENRVKTSFDEIYSEKSTPRFIQSILLPSNSRNLAALTCTNIGELLIWTVENSKKGSLFKTNRSVKFHTGAITSVLTINNLIITSGDDLSIKIHDFDFKLLFWIDQITSGPLRSLSLTNSKNYNFQGVPPLLSSNKGGDFLLIENEAVHVILKSPSRKCEFCCFSNGYLYLISGCVVEKWNIDKSTFITEYKFSSIVKSFQVTSDDCSIVAGMENGSIEVVNTKQGGKVETISVSKRPITALKHLLVDQENIIAYGDDQGKFGVLKEWQFVANVQNNHSHFVSLVSITTSVMHLFSSDKYLTNVDIKGSLKDARIKLALKTRLEYEDQLVSAQVDPSSQMLCYLSSGNRFKWLDPSTHEILQTISFSFVPRKIDSFLFLQDASIAFGCRNDGVIGVYSAPIDGNPFRYQCLKAHDEISDLIADGNNLVTLGRNGIVARWLTDFGQLEKVDDSLESFLLRLGDQKDLKYNNIKDMFYFAQLKDQGEDALESRESRPYVSIDQIPTILRSLNVFLSNKEFQSLRNELLRKNPSGKIMFDDFIKVYVNHKHDSLYTKESIQKAVDILSASSGNTDLVLDGRNRMSKSLQLFGEVMGDEELYDILQTLAPNSDEYRINLDLLVENLNKI